MSEFSAIQTQILAETRFIVKRNLQRNLRGAVSKSRAFAPAASHGDPK